MSTDAESTESRPPDRPERAGPPPPPAEADALLREGAAHAAQEPKT